MEDAESHSLRGAIDAGVLHDFRSEFERLEPLASGSLDDPVSPSELRLQLDDGIGEATTAAMTVRWSVQEDYNVHYSDDTDRNLRWDVHPHEYTAPDGDGHYHPPPNASSDDGDVEASCIRVTELVLVARAVHQLWRASYDSETTDPLNDATNSP
ncbi:hypothetical protein GCM10008995_28290 [Halobellus salinus]|uniref:Uncharacterized protein n=1 Tax=Halobellus salinus TaxID=931585 RepID=A0A830EJN2_9EURY|nr:hypothetical protein [Halobellus salinus]GGJ16711.1 hypothetical protein GCM10008995_28290 [Halobellus salinus]SMP34258.1 hypothetical protein SAMN06265347_12524 [Halobellus salinus]